MKKRILCTLIVASMAVAMLGGCAKKKTDEKSTSPTTAASPTTASTNTGSSDLFGKGKKVGITVPSVGNDFTLNLSKMMQAALTKVGCIVQFDSAESDVTKQIQQIENDVTMGCKVLIVWATNGEGVSSACKAAEKQGVTVLAFANEIPGASCSMISASDKDMGEYCVKMTSDWIDKTYADAGNKKVKVLVLTSSVIPEAVTRSKALNTLSKNSKVKIITEEVADWNSSDQARTMTENTMLANPDISVIVAANGAMAKGAESYVMSNASSIKDISKFGIFCVDEDQEIDTKIKDSVNNKSVLRGTISMGTMDATIKDMMTAVTPLIKGEEPKDVHGSAYVVTPDALK
jgi:ribose transport system substrate-binding protein